MDPVRLPRNVTLSESDGVWTLCWDGRALGLTDAAHDPQPSLTRIGAASGADALTEIEARRLARRYLLSQLPPGAQARRSQLTLAEFIERRFLPEFLAGKKLAWHAHYHSILRYILSPEDCERVLGINGGHSFAILPRDAEWPYLGHFRLRDVRPRHVHGLIGFALERGYSPQTVRHIRSLVSVVFSYAKQELAFAGANPTCSAKLPATDPKSGRGLTLDQMQHALGAMRYPEKQMVIISLLTDMNVSEICGLQWRRVNLTGAWLDSDGELIPPITIAVRKRWYRGELADVKTCRQRNIQIPEILLPMLLLLRGRTNFGSPVDFVLTSRTGSAINVSNITARRLGAIGKELGIPELTLQSLHRAQGLIKGGLGTQFRRSIGAAVTSDLLL